MAYIWILWDSLNNTLWYLKTNAKGVIDHLWAGAALFLIAPPHPPATPYLHRLRTNLRHSQLGLHQSHMPHCTFPYFRRILNSFGDGSSISIRAQFNSKYSLVSADNHDSSNMCLLIQRTSDIVSLFGRPEAQRINLVLNSQTNNRTLSYPCSTISNYHEHSPLRSVQIWPTFSFPDIFCQFVQRFVYGQLPPQKGIKLHVYCHGSHFFKYWYHRSNRYKLFLGVNHSFHRVLLLCDSYGSAVFYMVLGSGISIIYAFHSQKNTPCF